MKMFLFELDKTVVKNRGIFLIVLAVILKLVILSMEEHAINPFTHENLGQYLPIVNAYSGKVTQDASKEIEKHYTAVTQSQVALTALRQKYNHGEISEDNYYSEARVLEKLVNEKELFLTFYSQYVYAREKPEERYLLYDDGWNALLAYERLDWGFVLLTILLSASVFGREYESDMRNVLITTQKGNTRLIAAKFWSIFSVVILCSLFSSIVEYLFFVLTFGLPHGDFPLQSLRYFQDSFFKLTLHQTFVGIAVYRMIGLCILAVLVMLVSVCIQRTIVALSVGFMSVILPYALPVSSSIRYLLPSPLGFILAQGFFRGTQKGEFYQANEILFRSISPDLQIWLVVGWLVITGIMMLVIVQKFLPIQTSLPFKRKWLGYPLILIILALLGGCSSPIVNSGTKDRVFNLTDESRFTVIGNEIISLFPTFLMENMETHEINRIIRDPFADDATVDQAVASIFNREGKLYYLVTTVNENEVIELDPSTFQTSTLYHEKNLKNPALINSDLEVHQRGPGKVNIVFFVDRNDIYFLSDMRLRRVNSITGETQTLIKNIYGRNVAYDGKSIYYINTMFEIRRYDLANGQDQPLPDIRADFLHMRGGKVYYRNVDKDGTIYMYNMETEQNELVVPNRSVYFVCDDNYIYFTNQEDHSYLYRADLKTGRAEFIMPLAGYNIQIIDEYPFIYYRVEGVDFMTDTYRINKKTLTYEKIENIMK